MQKILGYMRKAIDNYNMTERMTDDERVTEYGRTDTRTDNLEHTTNGSETEIKDLTLSAALFKAFSGKGQSVIGRIKPTLMP
mgnify:CR=1 FL=1